MVAFSMIIGAILLLCAALGPHASRVDYLAGLERKHHRLENTASPKVVIIGGSNAAFGIDSEALEKALCMPVVNMSIHASLGFRFMVNEVKDELREGDLVIAAIEHSSYSKPLQETDIQILAVDRFPDALNYMPAHQWPKLVLGVMVMRAQATWKLIRGVWKDDSPHPIYRANGFTERGDLISHLDLPPCDPGSREKIQYHMPRIHQDFWAVADDLVQHAEAQGAHVVFSWPAMAHSSYQPGINDTLRTALAAHGLLMIGRDSSYVQPDTAFHDTHYHLRSYGRQQRTAQLIRDLCGSGVLACCSTGTP